MKSRTPPSFSWSGIQYHQPPGHCPCQPTTHTSLATLARLPLQHVVSAVLTPDSSHGQPPSSKPSLFLTSLTHCPSGISTGIMVPLHLFALSFDCLTVSTGAPGSETIPRHHAALLTALSSLPELSKRCPGHTGTGIEWLMNNLNLFVVSDSGRGFCSQTLGCSSGIETYTFLWSAASRYSDVHESITHIL